MDELSWAETIRFVYQRADGCCEYCQTCQKVCGQAMHVEHIDPAGSDHPNNLCLACPSCNLSKASSTSAHDPLTGEVTPLFNPRQQKWADHFEWVEDGAVVSGKTPTGRASVIRLKMNIERIVTARKIWIKAGEHPPASSI